MHYVDEQPDASAGERNQGGKTGPVLMVHGNPTWSFYFHALIAAIRKSGRAVAVDHIGCGLSDKPREFSATLENHICNLADLVTHLDLRDITLVGHDWGGAIGMGCLTRMPDRFSRIVLMNTAAFPPPFFPWRIRVLRTPLLGRLAVQGMNVFARSALTMATERGLSGPVRAGLVAPYDNWNNRRATYEFVRDIPTRKSDPAWKILEQIESQLASLGQKKLLIWGMRDWCFRPSCMDRFLRHWPDAATLELDDAGHYVMLDEPTKTVDAICSFVRGQNDYSVSGRQGS